MICYSETKLERACTCHIIQAAEYITFCLSFQETHPAFAEIVLKISLKKQNLKKKVGTEKVDGFNNAAAGWVDSLRG